MLSLSHSQTIARKASLSSLGIHGFHMSRTCRDLVAPPNLVSHMRPVIYDGPPSKLRLPYLRHPYSLSEFRDGNTSVLGNYELQFRLLRQQLDSLHQNFWLDVSDPILSCEIFLPVGKSNTRFYAAREAILSGLPTSATPRDKEKALSAFHKQWVMQEKSWTDSYTIEWRTRNFQLIVLAARLQAQQLKYFLASFFKNPQMTKRCPWLYGNYVIHGVLVVTICAFTNGGYQLIES